MLALLKVEPVPNGDFGAPTADPTPRVLPITFDKSPMFVLLRVVGGRVLNPFWVTVMLFLAAMDGLGESTILSTMLLFAGSEITSFARAVMPGGGFFAPVEKTWGLFAWKLAIS